MITRVNQKGQVHTSYLTLSCDLSVFVILHILLYRIRHICIIILLGMHIAVFKYMIIIIKCAKAKPRKH